MPHPVLPGECAKWIEKRGCDHPNLKKWMEKNCQKSCGHCTPEEGMYII